MKSTTFEDFLRDKHADGYTGLDDEMGDDCEEWICNLDGEELIHYAEAYGQERYNAALEDVRARMKAL